GARPDPVATEACGERAGGHGRRTVPRRAVERARVLVRPAAALRASTRTGPTAVRLAVGGPRRAPALGPAGRSAPAPTCGVAVRRARPSRAARPVVGGPPVPRARPVVRRSVDAGLRAHGCRPRRGAPGVPATPGRRGGRRP